MAPSILLSSAPRDLPKGYALALQQLLLRCQVVPNPPRDLLGEDAYAFFLPFHGLITVLFTWVSWEWVGVIIGSDDADTLEDVSSIEVSLVEPGSQLLYAFRINHQ